MKEAGNIMIWLFQTYTTFLRELEKMNDIKVKLLILLSTLFVVGMFLLFFCFYQKLLCKSKISCIKCIYLFYIVDIKILVD